jgi:hypothetical protein
MNDLATELLLALDSAFQCLDQHVGDCPTCEDVLDRTLLRLELAMTLAVNTALAPDETLEAVA